jgi:hypothetical protein
MKLQELQDQARKVLALTTGVEETNIFLIKFGGRPTDKIGLEDFIIRQSYDFKYRTSTGNAMESETIIKCKKTQVRDNKGRIIYILPNDVTFVWEYRYGGIEDFDRGYFESPMLS